MEISPAHFELITVTGPTASGKSDFAQELALEIGGEILNADSQQFYRGLDIGTGKLPEAERKVPHHLFDILEPGEWMSAGKFVRLTEAKISELQERGKKSLIVGGTGLYIRALLEGLDDLPHRDEAIRRKLEQSFAEQGGVFLYERLKKIDPLTAQKISAQDQSRLVRFLEIYEISGQTPSSFFQKTKLTKLNYRALNYNFQPERNSLREKISQRVETMLRQGWVEEVENLLKLGKNPQTWPNKPIGYVEISQVILGQLGLDEAKAKIIQSTQQYAKRQKTFFRGMFKNPLYQDNLVIK